MCGTGSWDPYMYKYIHVCLLALALHQTELRKSVVAAGLVLRAELSCTG